jgi:hypothetical protein
MKSFPSSYVLPGDDQSAGTTMRLPQARKIALGIEFDDERLLVIV